MYNVLLKFKYYYFDFMISNPNYPGKIISVLFASIPQIIEEGLVKHQF